MHYYGPPMSSLSAWQAHASLAYLCIYVCAALLLHVFVYRTPAQFKNAPSPSSLFFLSFFFLNFRRWEGGETQIQMCAAARKADSNPSRHYLPPIRALNGWINKSLFRIVFGEGIVPAVQPLGPWLELRESTLCNTPGGYEEQMSCLLPSSSRLKAAHTSLRMTSWKVEPLKLREFFFFFFLFFSNAMSIFGRWLAV